LNIQDYISSGIIETYALGLAGEEEARELEKLCLEYPEIKAAVQEAEVALESYAQLNAINPPEHVKDQIWSAINHNSIDETQETTLEKLNKPTKSVSKIYFYLAIAAALLIIIGLPYHFYKINQYRSEISTLKKEKIEILAQNKTFQAQIQKASDEVDIVINPTTKNILLAGVTGHEDKKTVVYWSQAGEVFLRPNDLPSLPSNKQYQLWAIIDGKPVNAGLVEQRENTQLQQMISVQHAEMFAITIEKQGGSKEPTMDQMIVAGKTL